MMENSVEMKRMMSGSSSSADFSFDFFYVLQSSRFKMDCIAFSHKIFTKVK